MILATFSLLLLLLALVLVVVVLLLLLLLKEEYQKHLPVWQSYQIHTVHRKSPNTGALRPSISNGKWDNVLSQEKSKHRGIAAVNFEWLANGTMSYSLARSPLRLPGSADTRRLLPLLLCRCCCCCCCCWQKSTKSTSRHQNSKARKDEQATESHQKSV